MITHVDAAREALRKDWRIPLCITVILIALIIISVVRMGSILISSQQTRIAQLNTHRISRVIPNIAQTHLFGRYSETLADLPQTQLQLTLQGIELAISTTQISRALIAAPNTPVKIYKVGDAVPGGAVIRHIFRDRIILDDNGRLEDLNLPVPKVSSMVTSATSN